MGRGSPNEVEIVAVTDREGKETMVRIPTNRVPSHPNKMLRTEFLDPMGITQQELADAIQVPYRKINELVNSKRGVTSRIAVRLAKFFSMSLDFWLNLQMRWDLFRVQQ